MSDLFTVHGNLENGFFFLGTARMNVLYGDGHPVQIVFDFKTETPELTESLLNADTLQFRRRSEK
jgi:prepilin-type processing-associated H-X9-DG protein